MQRSELEKLSRKELQALAKGHGVKANLSNNDIIAKLCELLVETRAEIDEKIVSTESIFVEEIPAVTEKPSILPEADVHAEDVVLLTAEDLTVGDSVEVYVSEAWTKATVKRVNKKSVRVCLMDTREELTVKFEELRIAMADESTIVEEAASTTAVATETDRIVEETVQKEEMELEEEQIVAPECKCDFEVTLSEPVVETETTESNTEYKTNMEVEEVTVDTLVEVVVESTVVEVHAPTEEIEVSLVQREFIPQAPPTPLGASARVSSIGWSILDSAVKCVNPASNRRKERRNARRSAMKQLAESMKMENEQTQHVDKEDVKDEMEISLPEEPAQKVVEESSAPELDETVQVVHIPEEPIIAPVTVAPTPAAFVASTPAAPAPATALMHPAKGEMLPRMNKAQAMRLGAIQKKIVSTDSMPVESVAFTNKAARPSLAPATTIAMTPAMHKRNSISTSAPSTVNQLNQPGAPFRKMATPLSGRASMLTSGTKRKMSDFGCNSANSTAPDFKRMHTKQFSALKSIAECVDQDKGVGVRMTLAMESAMSTNNNINNASKAAKATPQAVPAVAKVVSSASSAITHKQPAAVNPFSKVVNNTPSKKALLTSTPANVLTSRPGSAAHTGKTHGHGGGSSNIVKSRTVTSFVSSAAPSSCGHNNLTSFVNNENTVSQSAHNSAGGPTSFLKNKGDSVGAGKHRTVMLSGASSIRQQHLTML